MSVSLVLLVASLAAFALWRVSEAGAAAVVGVLLLALALALRYANVPPVELPRAPFYAARLLTLSAVAAFLLLGALESLLRPPASGESTLVWVAGIALLALATAPLLLGAANPTGPKPPLWPIPAGLLGGGALWLAASFTWVILIQPASSIGFEDTVRGSIFVLGEAGLVGGLGAGIWRASIRRPQPEQFDATGIFATAIVAAAAGTAVGTVATMWELRRWLPSLVDPGRGEGWSALLLSAVGVAWVVTLQRIRRAEPRPRTGLSIIVALIVALGLSCAAPLAPAGAREWTPVVLLMAVPITIASLVLILAFVPRLVQAAGAR